MKKETVVKIIAILVIPGSIPIYLGYKAFQLGKKVYDSNKKEVKDDKTKDDKTKD